MFFGAWQPVKVSGGKKNHAKRGRTHSEKVETRINDRSINRVLVVQRRPIAPPSRACFRCESALNPLSCVVPVRVAAPAGPWNSWVRNRKRSGRSLDRPGPAFANAFKVRTPGPIAGRSPISRSISSPVRSSLVFGFTLGSTGRRRGLPDALLQSRNQNFS